MVTVDIDFSSWVFPPLPFLPTVDPNRPDTPRRRGSVRFLTTLNYTKLFPDRKLKKVIYSGIQPGPVTSQLAPLSSGTKH
jgi:hypothetical protein